MIDHDHCRIILYHSSFSSQIVFTGACHGDKRVCSFTNSPQCGNKLNSESYCGQRCNHTNSALMPMCERVQSANQLSQNGIINHGLFGCVFADTLTSEILVFLTNS